MATDTRTQIMTEARELFLSQGLNGFSMRGLAARVGVTATALYRHFEDKDSVLASLLGEAFGTFGSYLGRGLAGRTALERLRLTGAAYIDFALEHPRDYELMFLTNCAALGFKTISAETTERSHATFEFLVSRVQECLDHGALQPRPVHAIALYAWSSLHGIVSLWLMGQLQSGLSEPEFRAQAALTLDRLLASLLPNAAGPAEPQSSHAARGSRS